MLEIEQLQPQDMEEDNPLQQLRSKATELFIREEWTESIKLYSQFIALCQDQISSLTHKKESDPDRLSKLNKSLCLSLSNRAEARSRLREFDSALKDCDEALQIEGTHFKTLVCKGKILLNLNKYSRALECFKLASIGPQASENLEMINGYEKKCKKLEILSRTGAFDVSDWVSSGFKGKCSELGEFVGCVDIKKSEISGRGLFATKNIDCGTLILVTKSIANERCILPKHGDDSGEKAQLVMWKNFIDKVTESATKCAKTNHLISTLSIGENEDDLEIPDISLFRPEGEDGIPSNEEQQLDVGKILSILDVNSLVEDAVSAKVVGKNRDYYCVGIWLLPSFINHSCTPNSRCLHIDDYIIVHASRDVKAGEELTFAYFDVLSPLSRRKEMARTWGFHCDCKRCNFEEKLKQSKPEIEEIDIGLERGGLLHVGRAIFSLEEYIKRWALRGKEKGFIRASFWSAFFEAYRSEKTMLRWGRRMPRMEIVVDSVVDAVGSDERILEVVIGSLKKDGNGMMEMERMIMKLGRGVYGKVMKKQVLKKLLEVDIHQQKANATSSFY